MNFQKNFFHMKNMPKLFSHNGHMAQWFRTAEIDSMKTPVEIRFGITRRSPCGFGFPADLGAINTFFFTFMCKGLYEISSFSSLV